MRFCLSTPHHLPQDILQNATMLVVDSFLGGIEPGSSVEADLLTFIGLADFAEIPASELSGGQRRLLALGRAMAMRPKLLMLDEPAAGLSPVNVDNLLEIVSALQNRYQLTVIIVEHILKVVMEMCESVTVLDHGQKIAEGTPQEIKDDHAVIEAYLGREMDDDEVRRAMAV